MFFSKQKSTLGVDIGTSYIKVVQIDHASRPELVTYGTLNSSLQLDVNSTKEELAQMTENIKSLIDKAGVTSKNCAVSLPNNSVFTSVIDMPVLKENELETAINFEAKKYVPLPLSEVILSWSVVGDSKEGLNKVLLIAVPKQIQEHYITLFQNLGVELKVIEIEALAIIRCLGQNLPPHSVIIDIGGKSTSLTVLSDGALQLTRSINVGSETITESIAKSLNISHDRADRFKKDFGTSEASFIPEAVKPILSAIKNEVKQLSAIYSARSVVLTDLILIGGGSYLPKIVEEFKDTGLKVSLGSPFANVTYNPEIKAALDKSSLQLPVATGLALRQI